MEDLDEAEIEGLLRRWKSPSFGKLLAGEGVASMLAASCLIFFKFRAVSKSIVTSEPRSNGIIGCFISFSEFMQIFLGYLILRYLRGRRVTIYFMLLLVLLVLELLFLLLSFAGVD